MSSITGIVRFCFSLELLRSSKSRALFTIALTAVFMGLGMSVASAQSTFGSILGAVQDPSGAAVAACKVTITNKGTVDLTWNVSPITGPGAAQYTINEMRSVKYNERQYFDHPAFGVIAMVSPVSAAAGAAAK